ncbi:MAG: hypothetical protein KBD19_01270 [Candidatus Moranbacteria bacterium]|nr:hypothetical protein [Candidatus Moranbacteria bacterium]
MATAWFEKFIVLLEKLILYPPYLVFLFVGAPILMISLIMKNWTEPIGIFFLYSAAGGVWRYIEKDLDHGIGSVLKEEKSKNIAHLVVISVYHIGNVGLFLMLLHYLNKAL